MSKRKVDRAAAKAAKKIKKLKDPTVEQITKIYQQDRIEANEYSHMP